LIIETIREPQGFDQAMIAMRNPMNSWGKSDSEWDFEEMCEFSTGKYIIGEKDSELSLKLQKAGPEHCKHLRMIYVWADITAPRYWWQEFDTYRHGVEKVSCSTMHKITSRPLEEEDFEHDGLDDDFLVWVIKKINNSIMSYNLCTDVDHKREIWRGIIQALPQSYLQKRTVCMSYAALRNIIRQREGHKLVEWEHFIRWVKSLPESWMITDDLSKV